MLFSICKLLTYLLGKDVHLRVNRHRFQIMDGMRGVAAIAVMLFHIFPASGSRLIGHGYLAVDFFFILSGFVIAYSYDDRLADGLDLGRFALHRAIRLYPLAIVAVLAVAVLKSVYPRPTLPTPVFMYNLAMNLALLPNSTAMPVEKFPFVPPSWSLFFELSVNLLYAAAFPWLRKTVLLALMMVCGAVLMICAFREGSVELLHRDIMVGMARTAFSFIYGVMICRYVTSRVRIGRPTLLAYAVLILTIGMPAGRVNNALYDLIAIAVIFPSLVWMCAVNPSDTASKIQQELGELSYPVYLLHMPVIAYIGVAFGWALDGAALGWAAACATIVAAALGWRFYDRPVRSWLKEQLLARPGRIASLKSA